MGYNIVKMGETEDDHELVGWYSSLDAAPFYNEAEYFIIEGDFIDHAVYDPVAGGIIRFHPPKKDEHTAIEVRAERDRLIAETDWWAGSDRTMTQAQIDYRQALRDITNQDGFPNTVTWPTKPE